MQGNAVNVVNFSHDEFNGVIVKVVGTGRLGRIDPSARARSHTLRILPLAGTAIAVMRNVSQPVYGFMSVE